MRRRALLTSLPVGVTIAGYLSDFGTKNEDDEATAETDTAFDAPDLRSMKTRPVSSSPFGINPGTERRHRGRRI